MLGGKVRQPRYSLKSMLSLTLLIAARPKSLESAENLHASALAESRQIEGSQAPDIYKTAQKQRVRRKLGLHRAQPKRIHLEALSCVLFDDTVAVGCALNDEWALLLAKRGCDGDATQHFDDFVVTDAGVGHWGWKSGWLEQMNKSVAGPDEIPYHVWVIEGAAMGEALDTVAERLAAGFAPPSDFTTWCTFRREDSVKTTGAWRFQRIA